jgi:hypothetical protein
MKYNNKVVVLVVLITAAVFAWLPEKRKNKDVSSVTSAGEMPIMKVVPRKRTEFDRWGRDPFTFLQEKSGGISNLTLTAIMWNNEKPSAYINESIVNVGDQISDKTIKQIEQNKVVLTDGTKDYVLELQE